MSKDKEVTHWSFDKRIPIAVLALFLMQFVAGVWYVAHRDQDITSNTQRIESLEIKVDSSKELLIRIDERLKLLIDKDKGNG